MFLVHLGGITPFAQIGIDLIEQEDCTGLLRCIEHMADVALGVAPPFLENLRWLCHNDLPSCLLGKIMGERGLACSAAARKHKP